MLEHLILSLPWNVQSKGVYVLLNPDLNHWVDSLQNLILSGTNLEAKAFSHNKCTIQSVMHFYNPMFQLIFQFHKLISTYY